MAAGERLGEQHHVGLDLPVLDRQEPAGAAEAGLHLVGDEQRAVLPAERRGASAGSRRGHVDALALDRLDDEGGDLTRGQRLFQRRKVVERDRGAARQQRLETARKFASSVSDKRAIGQAVERVGAVHDAGPAGGAARELDRGFDSFRPELAKKTLSR